MAFTLWNLFEASILLLNAVCVLHEERFLAKIGWGVNRQNMQGFGEEPSVKLQILNLVRSIRTVARSRYFSLGNSKTEANIRWYFLLFLTLLSVGVAGLERQSGPLGNPLQRLIPKVLFI